MMSSHDIRSAYMDYFKKKGHIIIPSASLVPDNDPTTLFTGSGMQPIIGYLLGKEHPAGTRIANSQKCFRAEDIEEVGDNRHTTFFEMLGNWSFGDYFKNEQLPWIFDFLTEKIGLDPNKIYVTVFAGDDALGLPRDTESARIWRDLFFRKGINAKEVELGAEETGGKNGMQGGRIFYYDAKKNWWSRSGTPQKMPAGEPGGPDSEIFFDFGTPHQEKFGLHCHPNCDCGRFMEIGNSVFMEYIKHEDGAFKKLPRRNVDFGGGLERMTAAARNNPDVFMNDSFMTIISEMEKISGIPYATSSPREKHAYRIIADHLRASIFIIGDGVSPSNTEQGYILRRLIRRAIRFADSLHIPEKTLPTMLPATIALYAEQYPNLKIHTAHIVQALADEETRFRATLSRGLKEFHKMRDATISGHDAFILFTTYGFPIEMTVELAREEGKRVDTEGFHAEMEKHQELSRAGSEQKFKGGLADQTDMSIKYHTATHLLHKALRTVLGAHALQKGSNITSERLRFDFAHPSKLTDEEMANIERLVNEAIEESLPVHYEDTSFAEAKKRGAIGLFEDKYGENVRLYQIGEGEKIFSLELCGGPHVENTKELGQFKIVKEEAVSQGVRRIKAILTKKS